MHFRNPRITFEVFCSVVSKLGFKMDPKRCLFEYQSIHSRTKDYLHIDEFNSWLVNSKLMKTQLERDQSGSAGLNRSSKTAVGLEKSQNAALQKPGSQSVNMVIPGYSCSMKTCK